MNMSSMLKMGPTGGETFTVTCFACGMPSSKEWAQRVRSRPYGGFQEPFYPFLLQMHPPPPGAIVMEDGSTYLCAFCHALLESQWNAFEAKGDTGSPMERKYVIHKFICAVCAVETYRKRIRALPFQEFPFLMKSRQPGSITLGNNPLAVVCLDCSETLWAQSAEYDRWGLPVQKRHFNWMARPPPPEDSVEATVARLPSGETQLPRCPPTDPLVPPKTNEPTALPEAIPPIKSNRCRTNSNTFHSKYDAPGPGSSRHHISHRHYHEGALANSPSPGTTPPRKSSMGGLTPPVMDSGSPHGQPPIVTVAPMSSQNSITYSRKGSLSYHNPSNSSGTGASHQQHKYESTLPSQTRQSSSSHGNSSMGTSTSSNQQAGLFHQASLFPSPLSFSSPGPFPWPNLGIEGHSSSADITRMPSPYGHFGSDQHANVPTPWPWLTHGSPELLRYQSYLASLQSRGLTDAFFQPPLTLYPPTSTTSSYLPHLQLQQQSSIRTVTSPTAITQSNRQFDDRMNSSPSSQFSLQRENRTQATHDTDTQRILTPGSSGSLTPPHSRNVKDSSEKPVTQRIISEETRTKSKTMLKSQKNSSISTSCSGSQQDVSKTEGDIKRSPTRNKGESSPVHRLHWKSKKSGVRKSSTVTTTAKSSSDGGVSGHSSNGTKEKVRRTEVLLPKKRHWQPPTTNSETTSASTTESDPGSSSSQHKSVLEKKRKFSVGASVLERNVTDFTTRSKSSIPSESPLSSSIRASAVSSSTLTTSAKSCKDGAIDLSVPTPKANKAAAKDNPRKFSIEYLCASDTVVDICESQDVQPDSQDDSNIEDGENSASITERNSVIVAVPTSTADSAMTMEIDSKDGTKKTESSVTEESDNFESIQEPQQTELSKVDEENSLDDKKDEMQESLITDLDEHEKQEHGQQEQVEKLNSDKNEKCEDNEEKEKHTELHVQFVTVGDIVVNPDVFVKTTVDDFVLTEKALNKIRNKELNGRLQFLRQLGLITPEMKMEIELEKLASRNEKNTIPPLKMRANSPQLVTIDEKLEQALMQIAFDDPSLKQNKCDPMLSSFLRNLGLKPCTKMEKACRELNWRQLLKDRFLREKKHVNIRSVQRPWTDYNRISKLFSPSHCRRSSCSNTASNGESEETDPLTFLTLTLPREIGESEYPVRRNSSDLLTIVEQKDNEFLNDTLSTEENMSRICIKYPKYIPSYAASTGQAQVKLEPPNDIEKGSSDHPCSKKSVEILNVPTITNSNNSTIVKSEQILKIPIVGSSGTFLPQRRSSCSTLKSISDDSDSEEDDIPLSDTYTDITKSFDKTTTSWSELENILKASTAQWEKTKKVVEEALSETNYLQSKENQRTLGEQAVRFREIRKHLKLQQVDMKETEKLFKGKEKQIMKKLRNFTKYSNKSNDANKSNPPPTSTSALPDKKPPTSDE